MKYSICVISYNGCNRLEWLFKSIRQNTLIPDDQFEILLVDDGSRQMVREKNKKLCELYRVRLIQHDKNKGIVRSWNRVIEEAQTNMIALLNDDILMVPGWLKSAMYFLEKNDENTGAIGFPTYFMVESDMPKFFHNNYLPPRDAITKKHLNEDQIKEYQNKLLDPPGTCVTPVGCAFCFKKSTWEKVGKFDEGLVSLYEDFAFSTELIKHGFQNYQLRSPVIYHCLSGTFSSNPELEAVKLLNQSEKYYFNKYGGKVQDVADKIYEKQKKRIKVKFLDGNLVEREEFCSV